jgi:hypothetical protein
VEIHTMDAQVLLVDPVGRHLFPPWKMAMVAIAQVSAGTRASLRRKALSKRSMGFET